MAASFLKYLVLGNKQTEAAPFALLLSNMYAQTFLKLSGEEEITSLLGIAMAIKNPPLHAVSQHVRSPLIYNTLKVLNKY